MREEVKKMGDLISKSVLIKNISKVCGDIGVVLPDQVWDVITAQPTAYDVERVVAEIQKKHCKYCRNILSVAGAEKYCKERKCEIEGLCDIVRKGGVE